MEYYKIVTPSGYVFTFMADGYDYDPLRNCYVFFNELPEETEIGSVPVTYGIAKSANVRL